MHGRCSKVPLTLCMIMVRIKIEKYDNKVIKDRLENKVVFVRNKRKWRILK